MVDRYPLSWYFDDIDSLESEAFYMNTTKRARLFLILSMTAFGTLAPFVRKIAVSSGELALYRAVLASLLIGGFLLVTKQKMIFVP